MRIIVDTNVLMSGIFFGGPPKQIIRACIERKHRTVISHDILQEYLDVAQDMMLQYPKTNAISAVEAIASISEMTFSLALIKQISNDPDDDIFLAAALAAKVPCIISGDKHLKSLNGWAGITILSPRSFIDEYIDT